MLRKLILMVICTMLFLMQCDVTGSGDEDTPPEAPSTISAVPSDAQNTISWGVSTGATSYTLYWSTQTPVTLSANKITSAISPHVHSGLTNNTVYYYAVTASNAYGESALSFEVSATPFVIVQIPQAPTGVAATVVNDSVNLSWVASQGATSYTVYWDYKTPVTKDAQSIANATSPYKQANLFNGIAYYYAVSASNTAGESGLSTEENVTYSLTNTIPPDSIIGIWEITNKREYLNGVTTTKNKVQLNAVSYNLTYTVSTGNEFLSWEVNGIMETYKGGTWQLSGAVFTVVYEDETINYAGHFENGRIVLTVKVSDANIKELAFFRKQ